MKLAVRAVGCGECKASSYACHVRRAHSLWPTPWTSLTSSAPSETPFHQLTADIPSNPKKRRSKRLSRPCSASATNLFVNASHIEDTDLYFLLDEFPVPCTYVVSSNGTTYAVPPSNGCSSSSPAFSCKNNGSMLVFQSGGWDALRRGQTFTPVCLSHTRTISPTNHSSEDSSVESCVSGAQERIELIVIGHSQRRAIVPLWISLDTVRLMRLAMTPNPTIFVLDHVQDELHMEEEKDDEDHIISPIPPKTNSMTGEVHSPTSSNDVSVSLNTSFHVSVEDIAGSR